jgi:hypothetical protein
LWRQRILDSTAMPSAGVVPPYLSLGASPDRDMTVMLSF